MRAIIVGDSPTVSTGFSRCVVAAADALHAAGHDVHILGLSYWGDPHDFPYTIWPTVAPADKCRDAFGTGRLPLLIDRLRPDACLILQDPFNIQGYFDVLDSYFKDADADERANVIPPIVGWLAADSRNYYCKPLNRLTHVAMWTQFGVDEMRAGGYEGPTSIIPLGVDHSLFYPRDKRESREKCGLPQDAFVVGVVGRNQHRKKIDLCIAAFHHLITDYAGMDKAVLYLHVAPTGDVGVNIRALVHHYNLHGRVFLAEPHIGVGVDNALMPYVYSSLDVLLSMSQAEGWNLPALEAMACGAVCVLPDFAAHGDTGWVGNAAERVPCPYPAMTAPMNTLAYTVGAVPDVHEAAASLNALYRSTHSRRKLRERGLAKAAEFSWERTGQMMAELLERVVSERKPGVTQPVVVGNEAEE